MTLMVLSLVSMVATIKASVRVSSSSTAPTTNVNTSSMRVPELSRLLTSTLSPFSLSLIVACGERTNHTAAAAAHANSTSTTAIMMAMRLPFCLGVSFFFSFGAFPFLPPGLGAEIGWWFLSGLGAACCAGACAGVLSPLRFFLSPLPPNSFKRFLPPFYLSRQLTPCRIISLYAAMVSLWMSFPRATSSVSVWS